MSQLTKYNSDVLAELDKEFGQDFLASTTISQLSLDNNDILIINTKKNWSHDAKVNGLCKKLKNHFKEKKGIDVYVIMLIGGCTFELPSRAMDSLDAGGRAYTVEFLTRIISHITNGERIFSGGYKTFFSDDYIELLEKLIKNLHPKSLPSQLPANQEPDGSIKYAT